MSIPFSGRLSKSGGLFSAISKQLRAINLKPVKKITVRFDPFGDKVTETRQLLYFISSSKALDTNPLINIKTEVLCDRSPPSVTFNLGNGDNVVFKSSNLSALEMLKLVNKHITVLAPPQDSDTTAATAKERKQKRK